MNREEKKSNHFEKIKNLFESVVKLLRKREIEAQNFLLFRNFVVISGP